MHLLNNLVGSTPLERDGGTADPASHTVIHGGTATFVDAASGDLHIDPAAPLGTGLPIDQCTRDADGAPGP